MNLDEVRKEVYVDREPGQLKAEPGAFQREQELRETGEQGK